MQNVTRRGFAGIAAAATMAGLLAGCSQSSDDTTEVVEEAAEVEQVDIRVAALKGPTAMGLVSMMDSTTGVPTADSEEEVADEDKVYDDEGVWFGYTISSAPDEVVGKVVAGQCDIALVPSNVASVLYHKTEGNVVVLNINTLGVLHVVTGNPEVASFEDLAGRTVYISGQGSTPEYIVGYLLEKAGIADSVDLQFLSEHTEVAARLAEDANAVGILPQPFATATIAQNDAVSDVVDLNDTWAAYAEEGSKTVMGVTIANREFAEAHPAAIQHFLDLQQASVDAVNADPEAAGELVAQAGILASAQIAAKAIPGCAISYIDGDEMQGAVDGFLTVLCEADASSVGGDVPGEDLYYSA